MTGSRAAKVAPDIASGPRTRTTPDKADRHRQNLQPPDRLAIGNPLDQQHKDRRGEQARRDLRHRQEGQRAEIDQHRRAMDRRPRQHRPRPLRPKPQPQRHRHQRQDREGHRRPRGMELPQPAIRSDHPHVIVGERDDAGIDQHRAKRGKRSVRGRRSSVWSAFHSPLMPRPATARPPERDAPVGDCGRSRTGAKVRAKQAETAGPMTALKKYQRLECSGLWRETPQDQRREVLVRFGDATLVLSDPKSGEAVSHWSLPAIERINQGAGAAGLRPRPRDRRKPGTDRSRHDRRP